MKTIAFLWLVVILDQISCLEFQRTRNFVPEIDSSSLRLSNITGTIYSQTFSSLEEVRRLSISSSTIDLIEDGALCVPSVTKLEILSSELPKLSRTQFSRFCPSLKSLRLENNDLALDKNVFSSLVNLVKLKLNRQEIRRISKEYFRNLGLLDTLEITRGGVEAVDAGAFNRLSNLKVLVLSHNKISEFGGVLGALTNLQQLRLDFNELTDFPWDDLKGLGDLEVLNVTSNKMTHYDVKKMTKYLPNLGYFGIGGNPLECRVAETTVEELELEATDRKVHYKLDSFSFHTCEKDASVEETDTVLTIDTISYTYYE